MTVRLDVDAALTYLGFVEERHRVWEARQRGEKGPWTADPILASRKFTNVFRVLDPGSQYVFRFEESCDHVVDLLTRLFLYRHTGRTEAWDWLLADLGEYPTHANLDDVLDSWKMYRGRGTTTKKPPRRPGQVGPGNGNQSTSFEKPLFTGAYLVFPQSQVPGTDKLESIIDLTQRMIDNGTFERFSTAGSQAERFNALRANKGVADFMSMQILTDWGYTSWGEDAEDEFVVLGPGARRGAQIILGNNTGSLDDVHRWAVDTIRSSPDCPKIYFPDPEDDPFRLPSYMDVQNTLCEFSKYVRFAEKPDKNTKPYNPAHPGPQPLLSFPDHW